MSLRLRHLPLLALPLLWAPGALSTPAHASEGESIRLDFHFKPVADLQIAIWLEDEDGNFVRDVFVTQATGKLGIGNRPGRWDFLSSWRFPYGPRPMVMPVWAHRRSKTYPKLVFFDDAPQDQESLGWHENSSSAESYYCRPLTPSEHEIISTDTMTCPSPASFRSDKGRFHETDTSVYPPRNDLITFDPTLDSKDTMQFEALNDLDSVTGATPPGDQPTVITVMVEDPPPGDLVAHIEVSKEFDENPSYDFTREDHFIDPRLPGYGVEFFGQPSVVYSVQFDPRETAFTGTSDWAGYGAWDGSSGTLNPPDATISTDGGSGADRLREYTKNGATFRFGVFSYGAAGGGTGTTGGTTGGGTGGWGACDTMDLPPPETMSVDAMEFDRVRINFDVPALDSGVAIKAAQVYYRVGDMPIDDSNVGQAVEVPCDGMILPGQSNSCEVSGLFGNTAYQFAVRYEDTCGNRSALAGSKAQTPAQEFAQVDGFCVVATAAYGANWVPEVKALRLVRDVFMMPNGLGRAFVASYYSYGPLLARAISTRPWARGAVRATLQPIANLARLTTSGR